MPEMPAAVEVPTEVQVGEGALVANESGVSDNFSDNWADMGKEMAKIDLEQGGQPQAQAAPQVPEPAPVVEPQQPAVTEPVQPPAPASQPAPEATATQEPTKPVAVPDKFKDASGSLDQEKVLKAYNESVKEMFRAQEAEKRARQAVQAPVVPPVPVQPVQPQPSSLDIQLAQRLASRGLDPQVSNILGPEMAEIGRMAYEAARAEAEARFEQVHQAQVERQQQDELAAIAKNDPWVFSPEGFNTLTQIRQSLGLNSWRQAYREHLADRALSQMQMQTPSPQVPTPSPKPPTAPPAPVGGAARGSSTSQPVRLQTRQELEAHLATLTEAQEAQFWKRQGYKWDVPPRTA